MAAITLDDIKKAAKRIEGHAVHTPLLRPSVLAQKSGGAVLLKPENLQRTGSFKFRGAYNRLSALTEAEKAKGVVAFSSGNHAQGVACAAEMLGVDATIVMPSDAPRIKLENTKGYGAEVVTYDRFTQSREDIANDISARTGAIVVPSYNDPYIMAGQGTSALEAVADCRAMGMIPDNIVICCGGGGLSSGSFLVFRDAFPDAALYTAEPVDFDDTARSLETGIIQEIEPGKRSLCDAILTPSPGPMPFEILSAVGAKGLRVSDAEAMEAVRFAANELKMIAELGGAVALAVVLSRKLKTEGKTTLVYITGGNIDPAILKTALGVDGTK